MILGHAKRLIRSRSLQTKTPDEHPVASRLDMTTKVDIAADTSRGEHFPLRHLRVVLHEIIKIVASSYNQNNYLFQGKTNPDFEKVGFLIVLEVLSRIFKSGAQVHLNIFPGGGGCP